MFCCRDNCLAVLIIKQGEAYKLITKNSLNNETHFYNRKYKDAIKLLSKELKTDIKKVG